MTKLAWVAEDASGNIFAVGLRQPGSDATEYGGIFLSFLDSENFDHYSLAYVMKLDGTTGAKIWEFDVPKEASAVQTGVLRLGFEKNVFQILISEKKFQKKISNNKTS